MSLENSRIVEFSSCGPLNKTRRKSREQNIYYRVRICGNWTIFQWTFEHISRGCPLLGHSGFFGYHGLLRGVANSNKTFSTYCFHTLKRSRNVLRSRSHVRTISIKVSLSVICQVTNITKFQFSQDKAPVWIPANSDVVSSLNIFILLSFYFRICDFGFHTGF